MCVCAHAPCLFLSILIGAFAAAAWCFSRPDGSGKHELSSSLPPSLPPFVIVSGPSSTTLLRSPTNTLFKASRVLGVRRPELLLQELEDERVLIIHFLFKDSCVIFPYQKVKVPVVLLLTQSRWRNTNERHRCSAGGLRQACCIQKPLVWGTPTYFSRSNACACSHRAISPCPSACDSSLYFPARTVHHSPPPASLTILQF